MAKSLSFVTDQASFLKHLVDLCGCCHMLVTDYFSGFFSCFFENMAKCIFIIRHVDYERLGHIPSILEELNLPYESISLALGDPFPDLDEVGGVITMGGPMSAFEVEENPWIQDEMDFVRDVVGQGIPMLGICLGGQILAQAFGAEVTRGARELGWLPLHRTEEADSDALFKDLEIPLLFQFHHDRFSLPEGAVHLLRSDFTVHQAIRIADKAYAIQFHPETNVALLKDAFREYEEKLPQEDMDIMCADPEDRPEKGRAFLMELLGRLFGEGEIDLF